MLIETPHSSAPRLTLSLPNALVRMPISEIPERDLERNLVVQITAAVHEYCVSLAITAHRRQPELRTSSSIISLTLASKSIMGSYPYPTLPKGSKS